MLACKGSLGRSGKARVRVSSYLFETVCIVLNQEEHCSLSYFLRRVLLALAPLDGQLANRLSNLSQTVDELTEDAVLQRRELPLRRAEAIKAREEVLDSLREKEDEQRLRIRKAGWSKDREGPPPQLTIERQDEVRKSLSAALAQADSLAEVRRASRD